MSIDEAKRIAQLKGYEPIKCSHCNRYEIIRNGAELKCDYCGHRVKCAQNRGKDDQEPKSE